MTTPRSTRHARLLLACLALLSLIAAACGSDLASEAPPATTEAAEAETVDTEDAMEEEVDEAADDSGDAEDAMEEEVVVEEETEPLRIVSVTPTGTEMLFAIGAGDQVVAVDAFSYFPAEAPVTDLSGFEPNVEAIAGFDPTLVLSGSPIEGLEAIGIDNVLLPAAADLDDIYEQIAMLGDVTGTEEGAATVIADMQARIDTALADISPPAEPLTYYHELDTTFFSVTSSTFVGYVYDLFGLDSIADAADPDGTSFGFPQLSEEFIVTADPDIIFLADTIFEEQTVETVTARPGWDALSAVQNNRVVELNDDIVSRWGPRIVEFIEAIAAILAEIDSAS